MPLRPLASDTAFLEEVTAVKRASPVDVELPSYEAEAPRPRPLPSV